MPIQALCQPSAALLSYTEELENRMKGKLFKRATFLALIAGMAIGSVAYAATFAEADSNSDGKLSLEEAQAANLQDVVSNFKKIDTDRDGFLSKAELKANR